MTTYRERLHVPWSWWLRGAVFVAVIAWIFLVATNPVIAICAALLTAAGVIALLGSYGSAEIRVGEEWLTAGRATIERKFCAEALVVDDPDDFRWRTGPGADARAYTLIRPYLQSGVVVRLDDPRDPTPYWLVSSRDPQGLAAALSTPTGGSDD